jgi:hypothetical protein
VGTSIFCSSTGDGIFFLEEKGNYIKLSIIKRKESFHHLMTLVALVNEINALEMDRVPLNTESRI